MEEIIVFGTGRYYQNKKPELEKNYRVIGFLDNAVKPGSQREKDGKSVYHPEDHAMFPNTPIILMSAKFYEMAFQLLALHVDQKRIRFGLELFPYYDEAERIFAELQVSWGIENNKLTLQYENHRYCFSTEQEYKQVLRALYMKHHPYISLLANMPINPVSRRFGNEIGTPIDRYYIEKFIEEHKSDIHGDVVEIADDEYTRKFGTDISHSYILHVNGWGGENVIRGNLSTGEGIVENMADCLICTQTIQMIYDINAVAANIYKLLKPNGAALITAHGISQLSMYDYHNWGEYWRFTKMSAQQLFERYFDKKKIQSFSYGNMKMAVCFMYGLSQECLNMSEMECVDEQYPLIIGIAVKK